MEINEILLLSSLGWDGFAKVAFGMLLFLGFAYAIKWLKIDLQVWISLLVKVSAMMKEAEEALSGQQRGEEKKEYVAKAIDPLLTKAEKKLAKKKGIGRIIDFAFRFIAPILARKI